MPLHLGFFRLSQQPHKVVGMPPPPSAVINAAIRALVQQRAGRQWWPADLRELARLQALYLEARRAEYEKAA